MIKDLNGLGNWFVETFNNYDGTSDTYVSASRIGSSVRKNLLLNRHGHEVEERASELLKATIGTALHEQVLTELGRQYPDSIEIEKRRDIMIGTRKVSAKTDVYIKRDVPELGLSAGTVIDLKTPNYGSWLWNTDNHYMYRMQLLCNASLMRDTDVDKAALWFLFTDWTYYQWLKNQPDPVSGEKTTYPSGKDFPMGSELEYFSLDGADAFVSESVYNMELHDSTPDDELPMCGPQDTWEKPPWKVYGYTKKGQPKARCMSGGSFFTRAEADTFASKKNERTLVKHMPELDMLGCSMCKVRKFCNKYKGGKGE